MKVLLIGAIQDFPTDGMINKGIHYLLAESGIKDYMYAPYVDSPKDEFLDTKGETPTHIIVCGGPWLWDGMSKSVKYKNVERLFARFPNAKKMFCSIGACFPLGQTSYVLGRLGFAKLDIFTGSTIIARDDITSRFLAAEKLPCAAYYAPRQLNFDFQRDIWLSTTALAVWYDPRLGVSAGDWQTPFKFEAYVKTYKDFMLKYPDTNVMCVNENEVASGEAIFGYRQVLQLKNVQEAYQALIGTGPVLSGRVHLAIPAHAIGRPTTLIPVDSRAKAFQEFTPNELERAKERYIEIFKEFLT